MQIAVKTTANKQIPTTTDSSIVPPAGCCSHCTTDRINKLSTDHEKGVKNALMRAYPQARMHRLSASPDPPVVVREQRPRVAAAGSGS